MPHNSEMSTDTIATCGEMGSGLLASPFLWKQATRLLPISPQVAMVSLLVLMGHVGLCPSCCHEQPK